MSKDHRIQGNDGRPIAFTCTNRRFGTNIAIGKSHSEHVIEHSSGEGIYWFMWYTVEGDPTIPMSGVFNEADLRNLVSQLASFGS